jgi:hypothetical protein
MPSESLSVCSVCGRPIPPKDYNGTGEGVCLVTDGRRCREAAITARLTAERRLAEALEALREVPCANRTREVGNPDDECNDERGYCARCRVLTGTPPVPAPVNHSAIPNSSAAPVADIVLEGEDAAAFAELHRNPPAPTPGLVRAMRRHAEAEVVDARALIIECEEARAAEKAAWRAAQDAEREAHRSGAIEALTRARDAACGGCQDSRPLVEYDEWHEYPGKSRPYREPCKAVEVRRLLEEYAKPTAGGTR